MLIVNANSASGASAQPPLTGVWLPIVTPFRDGAVDFKSYERLLDYYLKNKVSGLIPLGTTGEGSTIEDEEAATIVELTVRAASGHCPVYVGVGGNATHRVIKAIQRLERYAFEGFLSVCPYYNRPSEEGIYRHFEEIAASTERKILLYNIPYRTGVNLSNEGVLKLSRIQNIVGIKDSCANLVQSRDLLCRRPAGFSVLTGEDAHFYTMLSLAGNGGILAAAHYRPNKFIEVYERMASNDHQGALRIWTALEPVTRLLFQEPNPMPIKHLLWRQGLVDSPECRLPMTAVSTELAAKLDAFLESM